MKKKINYFLFISIIGFIGISNINALARSCVTCGSEAYPIPAILPQFISKLITLIQVGVPIMLIALGMFNYIKAVASGDDKVISEANHKFIRMIIAGVSVFLIVAIVKLVFTTLDQANTQNGKTTTSCITCFIKGDCTQIACKERPNEQNTNGAACYVCANGSYVWTASPGSDCSIISDVTHEENCNVQNQGSFNRGQY